MKKFNVVSVTQANPDKALEGLDAEVNKLLKLFGKHSESNFFDWNAIKVSEARIAVSTTPIGQTFTAYATVFYPKADGNDPADTVLLD